MLTQDIIDLTRAKIKDICCKMSNNYRPIITFHLDIWVRLLLYSVPVKYTSRTLAE